MWRDTGWTFGAEHEWGDIALTTTLPSGFGWDRRDITIVNSNGIANDPRGKVYGFGGEINTVPTDTPEGQVECLRVLKRLFPEAAINYRSNLHVHVRVPGLKEDLRALKQVQRYAHEALPQLLPVIEPIPVPTVLEFPNSVELQGAKRRARRRKVSHHSLLPVERLQQQLRASSVDEFFALEPPRSRYGKPLWHAQPRLCVNLRQLLQTDTVEFRHFPGTLVENELLCCVSWCERFLRAALSNASISDLCLTALQFSWPKFPEYVHWMEVRYRATVHDGTVPLSQIKQNIELILAGKFDECAGSMLGKREQVSVVRSGAKGGNIFEC